MDKLRNVLSKIQYLIEYGKGATEPDLKNLWNDLSDAITESDESNRTDTDMQEFAEWQDQFFWSITKIKKLWYNTTSPDKMTRPLLTTAQLLQEFEAWKEANRES